jgi:plasmid stabilization system protein ParE
MVFRGRSDGASLGCRRLMTVRWSEPGLEEFEHAVRYIRERDPAAARRVAKSVLDSLALLKDGRFDGPEIELSDGRMVRCWWVRPYRLYYQRVGDTVLVLRVRHHAQKPL